MAPLYSVLNDLGNAHANSLLTVPSPCSKISERTIPVFWRRNLNEVARTPRPYFTLLVKLMEDASSKYLVGQLISPIRNPKYTACAKISLSKTKSSEFFSNGNISSACLVYARNPVWYSESFTPRAMFSISVRNRSLRTCTVASHP